MMLSHLTFNYFNHLQTEVILAAHITRLCLTLGLCHLRLQDALSLGLSFLFIFCV